MCSCAVAFTLLLFNTAILARIDIWASAAFLNFVEGVCMRDWHLCQLTRFPKQSNNNHKKTLSQTGHQNKLIANINSNNNAVCNRIDLFIVLVHTVLFIFLGGMHFSLKMKIKNENKLGIVCAANAVIAGCSDVTPICSFALITFEQIS